MRHAIKVALMLVAAPLLGADAQSAANPVRRFVTVDTGVNIETLDFGGAGRPIVFLPGKAVAADSRNVIDFVRALRTTYHVYSMTRRGFAPSSIPRKGYGSDRLADDVLAVLDSLGLQRPVLIGHSMAGGELSSIGSRFPSKVAGLIYLDAGYRYALYDTIIGDFQIAKNEAYRHLSQLLFAPPRDQKLLIPTILDADLPALIKLLEARRELLKVSKTAPPTPGGAPLAYEQPFNLDDALITGRQRYTHIDAPVLAIYASPHSARANQGTDSLSIKISEASEAQIEPQIKAFERQVPKAKVVRLPNADHFVYRSNEDDVLREIRAFVATLPP
ncbi:MAG: alpha/beta hydrolase [Gemmatimonadaceae bacterium]